MEAAAIKVGLISDTHGLLRREAAEALSGVEHIIHAGDIDSSGILSKINSIAPVFAVRGNMDRNGGLSHLPRFDVITLGKLSIGVIHDLQELDLDPAAAGLAAVIHGHSHKPSVREKEGVVYINPGSAGPKRFSLPISMGLLHIDGPSLAPALIRLEA
jgi:hypothetical protein